VKKVVYWAILAAMAAIAAILLFGSLAAGERPGDRGEDRRPRPALDQLLYSQTEAELTPKEKEILAKLEPWKSGEAQKQGPMASPDGAVQYVFGVERPSLVCAVQQVTDVEFQAGEELTGVNVGDTVRWKIEPVVSGDDIPHLIIKPLDVGLETSMVVTTSRRTYHFRLSSHYTDYMPRVKFAYPEDVLAKVRSLKRTEAAERERQTIPETNEYLGDLDFDYTISGTARWKPTRVYNDGVKTIIEMPMAMRQTEAPALLVVRREGRLFKRSQQAIVNYRLQNNRYIVDTVIDKAVLIVGVGGNQERVTIVRKGGK
jgi:type IV secretion system protein VirB9